MSILKCKVGTSKSTHHASNSSSHHESHEEILSDYIGKKIIALEIVSQGINLSKKSLREIITTDKTFLRNGKFSRVEYEKFLLESGISAPIFEQNIAEQEKKDSY